MSQPAARVGDMHVCPMVTPGTPPVPHVGGPILPPGGVTVLIGNLPAARMGDMCTCVGPPDMIAQGAMNVLICGQPAARMGDMTSHGGSIAIGCPTVLIGMSPGGGGPAPPSPVQHAVEPDSAKAKEDAKAKAEVSPMDTSKFPAERGVKDAKARDGSLVFPNLGEDFEVLDSPTGDYNCIAHTVGEDAKWVNPVTGPVDPLSGMDSIYSDKGYSRSSGMDTSLEPGVQKVAVYATSKPDGSIKVTHGAIQRPDGTWESKLGQGPKIRHRNPEAVNGPVYGKPVAVYERPR